jgi:hypothetical protein
MARKMYRLKKSPLANKRNRAMLIAIAAVAVIAIGFGLYNSLRGKPVGTTGKSEIKIQTGDRPIAKEDAIYVNADGGLSLRADRNPNANRLKLIPNKTKLTATQELDGWYQVTYEDKTGWISKQYTTTVAPAEDPAKDWATFTGSGYKIKYQPGWKSQNYGANAVLAAGSLAAFSNQDLLATIPAGSEFIAPVTVVVSTKTLEAANASYSGIAGVQTEPTSVGGIAATKYTYTSAGSNTQMTAIVFTASGKVFIISEGGGYADDLLKMAATFTIG